MKTIKARCEAVGTTRDGSTQEVRFYVDGTCVKTLHHDAQEDFGKYVEGQEYDVEVEDDAPSAAPAHEAAEHDAEEEPV